MDTDIINQLLGQTEYYRRGGGVTGSTDREVGVRLADLFGKAMDKLVEAKKTKKKDILDTMKEIESKFPGTFTAQEWSDAAAGKLDAVPTHRPGTRTETRPVYQETQTEIPPRAEGEQSLIPNLGPESARGFTSSTRAIAGVQNLLGGPQAKTIIPNTIQPAPADFTAGTPPDRLVSPLRGKLPQNQPFPTGPVIPQAPLDYGRATQAGREQVGTEDVQVPTSVPIKLHSYMIGPNGEPVETGEGIAKSNVLDIMKGGRMFDTLGPQEQAVATAMGYRPGSFVDNTSMGRINMRISSGTNLEARKNMFAAGQAGEDKRHQQNLDAQAQAREEQKKLEAWKTIHAEYKEKEKNGVPYAGKWVRVLEQGAAQDPPDYSIPDGITVPSSWFEQHGFLKPSGWKPNTGDQNPASYGHSVVSEEDNSSPDHEAKMKKRKEIDAQAQKDLAEAKKEDPDARIDYAIDSDGVAHPRIVNAAGKVWVRNGKKK